MTNHRDESPVEPYLIFTTFGTIESEEAIDEWVEQFIGDSKEDNG